MSRQRYHRPPLGPDEFCAVCKPQPSPSPSPSLASTPRYSSGGSLLGNRQLSELYDAMMRPSKRRSTLPARQMPTVEQQREFEDERERQQRQERLTREQILALEYRKK